MQDKVFISVLVARSSIVFIIISHSGDQPTLLEVKARGINHFLMLMREQVNVMRIAIERERREIIMTVRLKLTHVFRNRRVN